MPDMDQTAALAREFERETYRIDQLIWDAMALRAGETVLFCGYANNLDWIKRAASIGVNVTVISGESVKPAELTNVSIATIRGSTSMIAARDGSFDAAVAFHYLHEVDPFFHANIITELGRVAKRCIIVEPAPPSDPLGLRIASLYSQAKRELGQFENYHHIEYWRKLLAIVKSDVAYETFTFSRTPPREAMRETVALIIDTMAAEATPESYLAELRALAKRPDAQLVPQARYVIVGTAVGERVTRGAGTDYRVGLPDELRPGAIVTPFVPPPLRRPTPAPAAAPKAPSVYSPADTAAELPPVVERPRPRQSKPAAGATPTAPAAGNVSRNAFGLPVRDESARPATAPSVKGDESAKPFGPPAEAHDAAAEFGWEWETPGKS
jgi:hypothetical protein